MIRRTRPATNPCKAVQCREATANASDENGQFKTGWGHDQQQDSWLVKVFILAIMMRSMTMIKVTSANIATRGGYRRRQGWRCVCVLWGGGRAEGEGQLAGSCQLRVE